MNWILPVLIVVGVGGLAWHLYILPKMSSRLSEDSPNTVPDTRTVRRNFRPWLRLLVPGVAVVAALAVAPLVFPEPSDESEVATSSHSADERDQPNTTRPNPTTSTTIIAPPPPPTPTTAPPVPAAATPPPTSRVVVSPPTAPSTTAVTLADNTFEVTFRGADYLCEDSFGGDSDCFRWYGGSPPSMYGTPDLYCSGSYGPECSELWYPNQLDDYDMVTMNGALHLCRSATGMYASYRDQDCGPYRIGDPDRVSLNLKCSTGMYGTSCGTDYYPSEMEGLSLVRIDYTDYLCEETMSGQECHRWYGTGSPKAATAGWPDLFCNWSGVCDESGYPSGY